MAVYVITEAGDRFEIPVEIASADAATIDAYVAEQIAICYGTEVTAAPEYTIRDRPEDQ